LRPVPLAYHVPVRCRAWQRRHVPRRRHRVPHSSPAAFGLARLQGPSCRVVSTRVSAARGVASPPGSAQAMFSHPMDEAARGEVVVEGISPAAFAKLLS
jgi:hypothetical protein